jgi:cytoskeleton protein RodZ
MQDSEEFAGSARSQPSALGLGERLRSARKARALSVTQIADSLRLEEPTVVALEEGRFEALGAPVFIRGHLKRYAELVGLSTEVVLDAYLAAAPGSVTPPSLIRPREAVEGVNLRLWGLWVVIPLLIIATIAYIVGGGRDTPVQGDTAATQAPAAAELPPAEAFPQSAPSTGNGSSAQESGAAPDQPATTTELMFPATPPDSTSSAAALPADQKAGAPTGAAAGMAPSQLVLRFTEDAWVNVSDADRRLLYGLQRRGSRLELAGKPPFRLMLGNARAVSLVVNGKPFRVPPDAVADNVARFDIPATAGRSID